MNRWHSAESHVRISGFPFANRMSATPKHLYPTSLSSILSAATDRTALPDLAAMWCRYAVCMVIVAATTPFPYTHRMSVQLLRCTQFQGCPYFIRHKKRPMTSKYATTHKASSIQSIDITSPKLSGICTHPPEDNRKGSSKSRYAQNTSISSSHVASNQVRTEHVQRSHKRS